MEQKGLRLETERLLLRSVTSNDAPEMYQNWLSDPEVARYLTFPAHTSVEQTQEVVDKHFLYQEGGSNTYFVVQLKDSGSLIGSIGLKNEGQNTGTIGYCFGKAFWNKGYATESCKAIVRFAFGDKGFRKVTAVHSENNMPSGKVLKKAGLKKEGYLKAEYVNGQGEPQNVYTYGLTADAYFGREQITFAQLLQRAKAVVNPRILTGTADCGAVGAAILSADNNIYTGICMDISCSLGFCAEHSAAAAMLQEGENKVMKMVAVNAQGQILPPCGRCRELISSLHEENCNAEIMVAQDMVVPLSALLPHDWKAVKRVDGTQPIVTERLQLMPINETYIADIFAAFDEQVTTYMPIAPPKEIDDTAAFVKGAIKGREQGKEFVYAITKVDSGEFLGCCGIHNIPSKRPELGIWTKTAAHGNGYGFETISALIAFIREHLPYHYIVYPVDKRNTASRRIPILHGATLAKEYDYTTPKGTVFQCAEYHIG